MSRRVPKKGSAKRSPLNLDRRILRRMGGGRSFERGEDYFAGGQVGSLIEDKETIAAKVEGSRSYRVKLWVEHGDVQYSCTCPVGQDGDFCKHCVAVGLEWLDQGRTDRVQGNRVEETVTVDDVRAYLGDLDKSALVDMLVAQAVEDDRLRRRLFMQAAKISPRSLNVATYRRAIDEAIDSRGFVDYREAYGYASGIEEAVDSIEGLLEDGHASEAIDLAEYALGAVENTIEFVDDSDGHMSLILERLQEVHLKACRKAKPDSEDLAERLFSWELRTDWDIFYGAAETYSGVLGKKGLAVYRELAEAEWAGVPALGSGQDRSQRYGKRFRITNIIETLARRTGDVEALVAVKKRDLSSAYDYLQIAVVYKEARKHNLALDWAERGVQAFPEQTDSRLREFLAGEYHRLKRHDEAMTLAWATFAESSGLEAYRILKRHADRSRQWQVWRPKALDFLRRSIAKAKRKDQGDRWAWSRRQDHTDLVQIFLWEKDAEAVWREANEGGCSDILWVELAGKRARDHPKDALPIYQRQVELALNRKNNDAYQEAIEFLKKVQASMKRRDRKTEFTRYLEGVRAAHKRKRNFMKLLDRERWA